MNPRRPVVRSLAQAPGLRMRYEPESEPTTSEKNPYVEEHHTYDEIIPAPEARGLGARQEALFGRLAPLHLEIGSGNGFYLSGMAALHPECDWIGLEIRYKRVVLAAKKLQLGGIRNARVVRWDAFLVEQLFAPGSLAGIHVNHPDPWAKERRAKHRLIGPAFLDAAASLLAPGGELRLRTDFGPHVTALLDAVPGRPFEVLGVRTDLRVEGPPWPDDVRTNYQRKSDERGAPVEAAWLRRT